MELQRGVCSLCSENSRVLASSDAEEFSKFLPEILPESFLTEKEFQKIKNLLKICSICCYKIQVANETKSLIQNKGSGGGVTKKIICHFCKTDKCLMKIENNWKNFTDRTEGYVNSADFPVCVCPRCLFYIDIIFTIKTKLTYKFPYLGIQKKKSGETPQKQNDTPKRKSLSKSPPSSKKRKIFDNCFAYLQPLCNNSNYYVDKTLKKDKRLYKNIAYVNLKNVKDVDVKETPKTRPIIKIKLKPPSKKVQKESNKIQLYIKLSKSEEAPNKRGVQKKASRRHSFVEKRESSEEVEEKLDETPKAASLSNLVPKRRVSVFLTDNNGEEKSEKSTEEDAPDDVSDIVKKYSDPKETEEKTNLLDESDKSEDMETNGVDKIVTEEKKNDDSLEVQPEEVNNGDKSENSTQDDILEENEKQVNEDSNSSSLSNESLRKDSSKNESNEGSESDTSDKHTNSGNTDLDTVNGSERKKKRVTFSDEMV